MRTKLFSLVIAAFLCSGVTTSAGALETNEIPKSFVTSAGGVGTCYTVELRDGILYYSATNGAHKAEYTRIIPTAQQWQNFRSSLDSIKVWQWQTNYHNYKVLDGMHWTLEIQYEGRVLKTEGSNNFPDQNGKPTGKPELSKTFKSYCAAVQRLLGGKVFR